ELGVLAIGCVSAFVVSILAIKFLMAYIKQNDFKLFGWYRIVLGIIVFSYFMIIHLVGA
ncbi:MAG: undecaprenyl-diphosphatase, partial [Clostridiales bacterium]|nr:undecaprenyl-diphosphatase [Clostridiales bacterium]